MLDVVNPPPPALIVRKRKSSTGVDLVVDEAQSSIEGLEPPGTRGDC